MLLVATCTLVRGHFPSLCLIAAVHHSLSVQHWLCQSKICLAEEHCKNEHHGLVPRHAGNRTVEPMCHYVLAHALLLYVLHSCICRIQGEHRCAGSASCCCQGVLCAHSSANVTFGCCTGCIDSDGNVHTWGYGAFWQLGTGKNADQGQPLQVGSRH